VLIGSWHFVYGLMKNLKQKDNPYDQYTLFIAARKRKLFAGAIRCVVKFQINSMKQNVIAVKLSEKEELLFNTIFLSE